MAAAGGHWVKGSFVPSGEGAGAPSTGQIPDEEIQMAMESLATRLEAEGFPSKVGATKVFVGKRDEGGRFTTQHALTVERSGDVTYQGPDETRFRSVLDDWSRTVQNSMME